MTHWRDPHPLEPINAPSEETISTYRVVWMTLTLALLLGAVACAMWGCSA